MRSGIVGWLQSPVLCCILVGTTVGAGAGWYRADAANNAPQIERYNWSQHPDALMIVVPEKGCGCGPKPVAIAQEAIQVGKDVVVVSGNPTTDTKEVQEELKAARLPAARVTVLSVDAKTVKRFAPGEEVATLEVSHGRILSQSKGASSYELLDRLWKAKKAKKADKPEKLENEQKKVSSPGGNHAGI